MKSNRHAKILELIQKSNIETQEELATALKNEGFQVTQATVSRDIRDLKLTKMPSANGKQYYVAHPSTEYSNNKSNSSKEMEKMLRVIRSGFVSCDVAASILVVKTDPGMASAVCAVIDTLNWEEIVGSLAGDDTIMCATRKESDAIAASKRLLDIINS